MQPAGTYAAKLRTAEAGESKSGTPQIELKFDVTYVLASGQWVASSGTASVYVYLSDAAWVHSEKKLKALGFNGDFQTPQFKPGVYDKGVTLLCAHEEYEGKPRARWELEDWGGREASPLSKDRAAVLAARFRGSGSTPAPAGRPTRPAPPVAVPAPVTVAAPAIRAPVAPPPAPTVVNPTSTPAPGEVGTKEGAWNMFCSTYAGAPNLTEWHALLMKVGNGKPENFFTADDWRAVEAAACPI